MGARELVFDIFAVDRASKVFSKVGSEAEGLGKKTSGMGGAGGVALAAVGAAAVAFGAKSIDTFGRVAAETLKLKRYLGGTTEDASRFRYEAKMSGIDTDTLSTAMGKLSKTLVTSTSTTKGSAKMFAQLGFDAKDSHGKLLPMNELLPKLEDKFKSMPDGANKTALAMQLFGKAGAGMLPMLNKGADGLKALGVESDKFGNTLSSKDTAAVKENVKQKREMAAAIEGLQIMLGRVLMPVVVSVSTHLAEMARWFNENVKVMGPLLGIVGAFIGYVFIVIKALQLWVAVQKILDAELFANPIGLVVAAVVLLIGVIVLIATKTTWFQTIWKTMTDALGTAFRWVWNSVLEPVIKFILNGFATVAEAIGHVLEALGRIPGFGWAKTAGDLMLGAAGKARGLANDLKDIKSPPPVVITLTVDGSGVSAAIAHVMGAVTGGQTKGGRYASGTDYAPGGLSLVGEGGPELVNLPRGAQVTTAQNTRSMLGRHDGATSADIKALAAELVAGFGAKLDAQARTIETMRRQMRTA